jgi:RNA polymerase sigma-70 factor (ECF subfamily)
VVPWLLGIARNHARRRLARERAMEALPDMAGHAAAAFVVTDDPVDGLARGQVVAAVRRALRTLPVYYREVVVLCDLQELSYADAADAVGCAIGTVRSRLHRGRAMLSARLKIDRRAMARRFVPGWV